MNTKYILVVDDEDSVRTAVSRMLVSEGYRVMVARDGAEALEMLGRGGAAPGRIDLLLTDVNMQELSGFGLVDALNDQGLAVPTLLMSGEGDESLVSQAKSRGCSGLLKKPFSSAVLIEGVRRALEDCAPGTFVHATIDRPVSTYP